MEEFDAAIRAAAGTTTRCAYVNFVGDEGEARLHDIYPDETQFRLNQNIPPA